MSTIQEINERPKVYLAEADARLHSTKYVWSWGVPISIGLGLLAVVVGLSLSILSWFALLDAGIPSSILGASLLLIAFTLFYFAAHCMDKVDEARKAIRQEQVGRIVYPTAI